MSLPPVAPTLIARLANYELDDQARLMLREMRAIIEPELGRAIDEVITGAAKLVQVADIYRRHGDEIREIELVQFRAMLSAEFDEHYLDVCRTTVDKETSLGFEGRARLNCGAAVLRYAIVLFGRKHRLS